MRPMIQNIGPWTAVVMVGYSLILNTLLRSQLSQLSCGLSIVVVKEYLMLSNQNEVGFILVALRCFVIISYSGLQGILAYSDKCFTRNIFSSS